MFLTVGHWHIRFCVCLSISGPLPMCGAWHTQVWWGWHMFLSKSKTLGPWERAWWMSGHQRSPYRVTVKCTKWKHCVNVYEYLLHRGLSAYITFVIFIHQRVTGCSLSLFISGVRDGEKSSSLLQFTLIVKVPSHFCVLNQWPSKLSHQCI